MNRASAAGPSNRPIPPESATPPASPQAGTPSMPTTTAKDQAAPAAADRQPSVTVVVRGFETFCWRCRKPTTSVVAVHAQACEHSEEWVWFEDKPALELARRLLLDAGQDRLAAAIKQRFSRTASARYLSNGCLHCDAIQGDWPLGQAISDYASGVPLGDLAVLSVASIPRASWEAIFGARSMRRYGYRIDRDDADADDGG
jgi:hypothetical protein